MLGAGAVSCARGGERVPVLVLVLRAGGDRVPVLGAECRCRCWCCELAVDVVETVCVWWRQGAGCRCWVLALCLVERILFARQAVRVLFQTTMSWLCARDRPVPGAGACCGAGAGCWQCAWWRQRAPVRVVKTAARVVETGCRVLGAGAGLCWVLVLVLGTVSWRAGARCWCPLLTVK